LTFFLLNPSRAAWGVSETGPVFAKSPCSANCRSALGQTKNAPAIANVRAQDARRKKNFVKMLQPSVALAARNVDGEWTAIIFDVRFGGSVFGALHGRENKLWLRAFGVESSLAGRPQDPS